MNAFTPIDFGELVPGLSSLTASGTTQADAYILTKKVNVFSSVPPGSGAVLPSSYSPGAQIWVLNRDPANTLLLYPPLGDRIEANAVNTPINVVAAADFVVVSFDPPLARSPRTWWLSSFFENGAFVPTTGGTMTGQLIINNASGTSLDARHNVLIGGTLGVTGATSVAALAASGAVTGAGFTARFSTPGPIGNTTPSTGAFTTLNASTSINSPIIGDYLGTAKLGGTRAWLNPLGTPMSAGAVVPTFLSASNLSGTFTDTGYFGWNQITVPQDTAIANGAAGVLNDLYIAHNFGGAGFSGFRNGVGVSFLQTGDIAIGSPFQVISGISSGISMLKTWGGTALTPANARGYATAMNPYLVLGGTYTNGGGGSGMEVDISGRAGATFLSKVGIVIALDGADTVQGTRLDAALLFNNQSIQGAGRGWKTLISSGGPDGYFPMDTGGSFWNIVANTSGDTLTVNKGLAWANGTFTTSAIETPGFTVGGTGIVTGLNYRVGANQVVGARQTGWSAMTGTPNIAAVYDTASVTLAQLAGRVASLQASLTTHGMIGP